MVRAWEVMYDFPNLRRSIPDLEEGSRFLDDINLEGGYQIWRTKVDRWRNAPSHEILDEILERGTQDRIIGDYTMDMVSDKIQGYYITNGFNINLLPGASESNSGIRQVLRQLEADATQAGASFFHLRLHSVINPGFRSPRLWELLGYKFVDEGGDIISVTKDIL
jgi:hypothetical protein